MILNLFIVLVAWHYYEEQINPGNNTRSINRFVESSREWFPVTKLHEIALHKVFIFGSLAASWLAGIQVDPAWSMWALGVAVGDAVQHWLIFGTRVSGYRSGVAYGAWAFLYSVFEVDWDAIPGWGFLMIVAGTAAVLGNLAFLRLRAILGR